MNEDRSQYEEPLLPLAHEREILPPSIAIEKQWLAGERPQIEDYLPEVASSLRATLLKGLLVSELGLRQAAGQEAAIDEYFRKSPADRTAVEAGWAMVASRPLRHPNQSNTLEWTYVLPADTGNRS